MPPPYREAEFPVTALLMICITAFVEMVAPVMVSISPGTPLPEPGLTGIRDGFDARALNDFNKAIELKADFALAYHERAGIKKRMGDLQGAHGMGSKGQ